MAVKKPQNLDQLDILTGVGAKKCDRYGLATQTCWSAALSPRVEFISN